MAQEYVTMCFALLEFIHS